MQRRTWLKLGIGSAAVLATLGTGLVLIGPGLDKAGVLAPAGQSVFRAVGNAILQGTLPKDSALRQKALSAMLQRIDLLVQALPPHAQQELSQLLAILYSAGGRLALTGMTTHWDLANVEQIQQALQNMRMSGLEIKRQAYAALHDITAGAYFSDASTWGQLGYPGPSKI